METKVERWFWLTSSVINLKQHQRCRDESKNINMYPFSCHLRFSGLNDGYTFIIYHPLSQPRGHKCRLYISLTEVASILLCILNSIIAFIKINMSWNEMIIPIYITVYWRFFIFININLLMNTLLRCCDFIF
jgi:hypothetical protein